MPAVPATSSTSASSSYPGHAKGNYPEQKWDKEGDPHGCAYINEYCKMCHKDQLDCTHNEQKGRILTAKRDYEMGEMIFEVGGLMRNRTFVAPLLLWATPILSI